MEELKIEKNIPIPCIKRKKTILNELLPKLEVGDSFVVSKKKYANITRASNKHGIKIISRSVTEHPLDKGDFVRVWRVE